MCVYVFGLLTQVYACAWQVFVADGGNLYVEEVEKYMRIEEFPPSPPPPPDNLASSSSSGGFDPLCNPPPRSDFPEPCWSGSLLLLVPLRFGNVKTMGSLSAARRAKLVDYFKIEAGVGVLGGTPRHAIWFYGCDVGDSTQQGENNTLYGLDPHTVQVSEGGRAKRGEGSAQRGATGATFWRRVGVARRLTKSGVRTLVATHAV